MRMSLLKGLVVLLVISPLSVFAQDQIKGCIKPNGVLRVISNDASCPNNQTEILWDRAGKTGPAGATGATGATGSTGATGPQGAIGPQGLAGSQGAQGFPGANGGIGPQGLAGSQGAPGAKGDVGPQGTPGATGAAGATGEQGAIGPQGLAGSQGAQGAKGEIGPQGISGAIGAKGDTGAQGARGPQGLAGSQGPTGVKGDAGPEGIPGLTGAKGDTGPAGLAGSGSSEYAYVGNTIATFTRLNWEDNKYSWSACKAEFGPEARPATNVEVSRGSVPNTAENGALVTLVMVGGVGGGVLRDRTLIVDAILGKVDTPNGTGGNPSVPKVEVITMIGNGTQGLDITLIETNANPYSYPYACSAPRA